MRVPRASISWYCAPVQHAIAALEDLAHCEAVEADLYALQRRELDERQCRERIDDYHAAIEVLRERLNGAATVRLPNPRRDNNG